MQRDRPRPRPLARFLGAGTGDVEQLRAAGRRLLWGCVRQVRVQAAVLLAANLATVAFGSLLPAAIASAVDAAVSAHPSAPPLTAVAALLAGSAAAQAVADLAGASAAAALTAGMRHRLVRHALELGPAGRHPFVPGEVLSRLAVNASAPADFLPLLLSVLTLTLRSAAGLVGLALIDVRLAAVFLLGLPVAVVLVRRFLADAAEPFLRYQQLQAGIVGRLVGAFRGVRTIRASGTVGLEIARVLAPLPDLHAAGRLGWELQGRIGWRLVLLAPAVQLLVLSAAGLALAQGRISPGELLAASGYVAMALGAVGLADTLVSLLGCQVGAGRLAQVLQATPQVTPPAEPLWLASGPGRLELRGIQVRVGDRVVLDEVDLTVPGGTRLAVVGASGSGKSTLVALAGRLLDPDRGEVLLDGVPVHRLPLPVLRRAVAYAFDRPALLGSTIHDTIAYGRPETPRAAVVRAARTARVDRCVQSLPSGYDTPPDRAPLSGGELQRLGLARAILADARILVLDDALSSLDTATEFEVTAALDDALAGRTSLVVAHRPATAARADRVAWLDGGRLRAVDRHHRLWADPAYRKLFAAEGGPAGDAG